MGGQKRHFKGNNRSADKRRRKENADRWKNTRGDDREQQQGGDAGNGRWALTASGNKRFEAFYKAQGFLGIDEWDSFKSALVAPLPACFRINPDYAFADELERQLLGLVGQRMEVDGVEMQPVQKMAWYSHAFKLGTDRRSIRKLPGLEGLHKWMMVHTDCGNITRQEAVSMVPPLALDVQPHHKCLDMCAAPGSKTSQMVEIVHRSLYGPEDQQGLVVANDSDTDRAYMLVHQCKRINSPLLMITTHKGQQFPRIDNIVAQESSSSGNKKKQSGGSSGYFDRVLCDVPCSGDGTLRKNPAIWSKWMTSAATTLHPLQLMIAQRGLQLLKTGGLMVYSTCSMSPYEDEAVVAELLRTNKGTLELVDAREFLPLFKARPGLSTWYVLDDYLALKKEGLERKQAAKTAAAAAREAAKEASGEAAKEGAGAETAETNADAADASADADGAVKTSDIIVDVEVGDDEAADGNDSTAAAALSDDPLLRDCIAMGMKYYPDFSSVPSHLDRKVRKSLFPPTEEEKEWMHLERCLRCVPHDEDTGGFFVATLRKLEKPAKPSSDDTTSSSSSAGAASATKEGENEGVEEEVTATVEMEAAATACIDATAEAADAEVDAEAEEAEAEAAAAAAATDDGDAGEEGANAGADGGDDDEKEEATEKGFNPQKGLVNFKPFSVPAYEKLRDYYGFTDRLPAEAFFIREDHTAPKGGSTAGTAKSVYYIPLSVRQLMKGDTEERLKVVSAGIKVLERKQNARSDENEYRLLQEGIDAIVPYITTRKVSVTIQDFCNLLGSGLVSFSTLSAEAVKAVNAIGHGVLICEYKFRPSDVIEGQIRESIKISSGTTGGATATASGGAADATVVVDEEPVKIAINEREKDLDESTSYYSASHHFYAICWRGGSTRTLNVMCGKKDVESMKHKLGALGVLRPKIAAVARFDAAASAPHTAAGGAVVVAPEEELSSSAATATADGNVDDDVDDVPAETPAEITDAFDAANESADVAADEGAAADDDTAMET